MNILMVCMGNICRSPMAEGIARHIAQSIGREDIHFDSAGTHAYHVGEAPDPRAQKEMQRHGIDISRLSARVFTQEDFARFDVIMVADEQNLHNVLAMAANDTERSKVRKMRVDGQDVGDPYYGSDDGFSRVYNQLYTSLATYLECL